MRLRSFTCIKYSAAEGNAEAAALKPVEPGSEAAAPIWEKNLKANIAGSAFSCAGVKASAKARACSPLPPDKAPKPFKRFRSVSATPYPI